jgi:serine/threonine-protein kinase
MARYSFDSKPHGEGGFGRIIKGRDNELERNVAVKVMAGLKKSFPEADQERFRREARILAKLGHPNIPAIYDVNFEGDNLLIIFQFVAGANLKQTIAAEGPCQLSEVRNWFHQIGSALDHAHAIGIIHRDVKPDNIVITPDRETAYLVDFGIALSAEETKKLTERGFAVGTPGYMSPEQVAGQELDGRTDVYSLGVTLYEALAGTPVPIGEYRDLSVGNESIPPEIDELIRESLQPVNTRIPSAKVFNTKLAGALRPRRPLSEILAHGRLHEIATALEDLNAEEFSRLADGQRTLILLKCDDIVNSGEEELRAASARFLELLLSRAILLGPDDYQGIVAPAIYWAFEQVNYGRQGSVTLQNALERAASEAREGAHGVIAGELIKFLASISIGDKPGWYLRTMRNVLNALMANPVCRIRATELGIQLKAVNRAQRALG